MNEELILERLKNGDKDVFIEVVNNFKSKIINLCYSYTTDYGEAEDLSQEVFISLYKNIYAFRGECKLSTYIYKITLSRCLDYKRKRSIKSFLTDFIGVNKEDNSYIDLDEKTYVRQCIKTLPTELKNVIVLYYYLGLTQKEIGDILNITAKAVEGKIYRAKKRLKKELQKGEGAICKTQGII